MGVSWLWTRGERLRWPGSDIYPRAGGAERGADRAHVGCEATCVLSPTRWEERERYDTHKAERSPVAALARGNPAKHRRPADPPGTCCARATEVPSTY